MERTGSQSPSNQPPSVSRSDDGGIVDKLRNGAAAQLNNQKNRATDQLGTVVDAARQSTERLRERDHDTIARYVEQAANQIDRLSERLRNKDVAELISDIQRLARRQPAVFVGGAFAAGLIGARFFKSSARAERDDEPSWSRGGAASSARSTAYGTDAQTGTASAAFRDRSRVHDYGSYSTAGDPGTPAASTAAGADLNEPTAHTPSREIPRKRPVPRQTERS